MNRLALGMVVCVALASPALGAVKTTTPQGFEVVEHYAVATTPSQLYRAIANPARWWNPLHSFSGSAANLSIDPRAGGCFCERLKDGGSVQHMTVVYAAPGKALRLRGTLGPLQNEGVEGALTFALTPGKDGTQLDVSYIVGGYLRKGPETWAPIVDEVLDEQVQRLKRYAETGSPEPVKP
jgi:uncharacterized protein YndB with AHSA1/START domain